MNIVNYMYFSVLNHSHISRVNSGYSFNQLLHLISLYFVYMISESICISKIGPQFYFFVLSLSGFDIIVSLALQEELRKFSSFFLCSGIGLNNRKYHAIFSLKIMECASRIIWTCSHLQKQIFNHFYLLWLLTYLVFFIF